MPRPTLATLAVTAAGVGAVLVLAACSGATEGPAAADAPGSPSATASPTSDLTSAGSPSESDPGGGTSAGASPTAGESSPGPSTGTPATPSNSPGSTTPGRAVFPGSTWARAKPAALGFDAGAMRRIAREAKATGTTCLLVVRKGRIVGEWNWRGLSAETPREVFSITKSVTSTLVGLAQADGDLRTDQRASRYIRQWRGTPSAPVTIRNLLSNDSGREWDLATDYGDLPQAANRTGFAIGLGQQYPPGDVWTYNNAAIQTLDRVLSRATGQPTRDYAAARLFAPLGMTHTRMTPDSVGGTNSFFGLQTTCQDLARFGHLFLQKGRWGNDRVLPASWVRQAVGRPSQDHNAAYGLLWWLNRRGPILGPLQTDAPGQPAAAVGQLIPGASAAMYAAQGLGGQVALVDPRTQTVVVRLGDPGQLGDPDRYSARDAARFVTEALVRP